MAYGVRHVLSASVEWVELAWIDCDPTRVKHGWIWSQDLGDCNVSDTKDQSTCARFGFVDCFTKRISTELDAVEREYG